MPIKNKIRIAFIKFGGLSAGGTEKFLQTIAANLNPSRFDVTYFYCDTSPYKGGDFVHAGTDPYRTAYMKSHGVKMTEFKVGTKDITDPLHTWIDTDFWEKFNENDFDIIQTGRAGHKEYPFNKISKTPIIDSLHLTAGVDNQFNIAKVMHITKWSADKWVAAGGDKGRVVIVSHPMEIDAVDAISLREKLNIGTDVKIFGFHQRHADSIFSSIPLEAYKKIESDKTHFLIMGGSELYRKQATELGIKNISFIDHSAEQKQIYSFLKTLDVYAHGRKDGEVNSTAMAEAMYFGLPIVSHLSDVNNGHVECIADAGIVVDSVDVYAAELEKLQNDFVYYEMRRRNSLKRFAENYELRGQIMRIESIYESVAENPFPHPVRRFLYSLHWTQNIRIWLKWVYLKMKYILNDKI
jgi:glycosyltransferase involved in cell wall biosynthesis